MKISFVIPAYNEEKNVQKCIGCVLAEIKNNKLETDSEVVVVDNASTDNTAKIISETKNVRLVSEPHKGLVWARRAGFINSSGELVANVDADTLMPQGWLKRVILEFEGNQNLVALSGPFTYYDLSLANRVFTKMWYVIGFVFNALNSYLGGSKSMLQGGNFVIKREAMRKIGGYDTSINFYGEDTDVGKRMSKIGDVKWTFKLPMYSSGRRLQAEGLLIAAYKYAMNFIWVTFKGKPFNQDYKDVRPK